MTHMCEQDTWDKTAKLTYSRHNHINVLDRVFALLEGRVMPEREETTINLCRAASAKGEREVVTFWGRLKMHLNGNLHIWLTDKELIRKLTETAAGHTLTKAA